MLLRKAKEADYDFFFYIKSEPENMYWTGHKNAPNYKSLKKWFYTELQGYDREILIFENEENAIGYAYVNFIESNKGIETAVAVSNQYSGLGYGTEIVKSTIQFCKRVYPSKYIQAWILDDNLASIRIHKKAGYKVTNEIKHLNEQKLCLYQYDEGVEGRCI